MKQYKYLAMGGTFDFLHIGHQKFIDHAFSLSAFVSIGIVSDRFAKQLSKVPHYNFKERSMRIREFLNKSGFEKRFKLIELDDVFGNTLSDPDVDSLLVSGETQAGAKAINKKRVEAGLKPLDVIVFKDVTNNDIKVSSSLIRQGLINADGFNFEEYLTGNNFFLPSSLRGELTIPFGKVLTDVPEKIESNTITVGDQTIYDFVKTGKRPRLSIVDFNIQRIKVFSSTRDLQISFQNCLEVKNMKGEISKELSSAIAKSLQNHSYNVIVVDGEEDLATLPAVLLAPVPSEVYYGLRDVGLIQIKVDLEVKDQFLSILNRFKTG